METAELFKDVMFDLVKPNVYLGYIDLSTINIAMVPPLTTNIIIIMTVSCFEGQCIEFKASWERIQRLIRDANCTVSIRGAYRPPDRPCRTP